MKKHENLKKNIVEKTLIRERKYYCMTDEIHNLVVRFGLILINKGLSKIVKGHRQQNLTLLPSKKCATL